MLGDRNGMLKMVDRLPLLVTTVQSLSRTRTPSPAWLTIGSMAMVMPGTSRTPCRPGQNGDLRIFMRVMATPCPTYWRTTAKPFLLHQCLNRCADIADPMAGLRRLNTQIQAFLRYVQKLLGLFADLPHRKGKRIVSVESADTGATSTLTMSPSRRAAPKRESHGSLRRSPKYRPSRGSRRIPRRMA